MEIVRQKARERFPQARPRVISDNGPQFLASDVPVRDDFKEFIRVAGMTHARTSPHYPRSNGKAERWHKTLKSECIRPKTPLCVEQARSSVTFITTIASAPAPPSVSSHRATNSRATPKPSAMSATANTKRRGKPDAVEDSNNALPRRKRAPSAKRVARPRAKANRAPTRTPRPDRGLPGGAKAPSRAKPLDAIGQPRNDAINRRNGSGRGSSSPTAGEQPARDTRPRSRRNADREAAAPGRLQSLSAISEISPMPQKPHPSDSLNRQTEKPSSG